MQNRTQMKASFFALVSGGVLPACEAVDEESEEVAPEGKSAEEHSATDTNKPVVIAQLRSCMQSLRSSSDRQDVNGAIRAPSALTRSLVHTMKQTGEQEGGEVQAKKKRKLNSSKKKVEVVLGTPKQQQLDELCKRAAKIGKKALSLFEWVDGALVKSMKKGGYFLIDEISLAEDAVLERLNSLFEPEKTPVLAESSKPAR